MTALILAAAILLLEPSGDPCQRPVTLSFNDAPLREVVQMLESICQRSILITPRVSEKDVVSIDLQNETIDHALARLLKPRGYAWKYGGATFKLTEPPHAARIASDTAAVVKFAWTPAPGASTYKFDLARGRDFGRPHVSRRVTETFAAVKGLNDGTYFWRVEALGSDGQVLFVSEPHRFELGPAVEAR